MLDIHRRYGLPVGGVVATDAEDGVVSPAGQGYGWSIMVELRARGLLARAGGHESLAGEMSEAYKDVQTVVDVVQRAGLSRVVARRRPLGVVMG